MPSAAQATEYIPAKNDLRKKVRELKGRAGEDPVARAEAALAILSTHFDDWMRDETRAMTETLAAWAGNDYANGADRDAFFRAVHDIKGQSATLGFPLASQVAGSLCALLDRVDDRAKLPIQIVRQHVDSIRAIVRERAKDETDRVGSELTQTLIDVTRDYIRINGREEAEDDGVIVRDL